MFGVRNEDSKWRLCLFRGTVLHGTRYPDGTWKEYYFTSVKDARACVAELNTLYWPTYSTALKHKTGVPESTAKGMMEVIDKYRFKYETIDMKTSKPNATSSQPVDLEITW